MRREELDKGRLTTERYRWSSQMIDYPISTLLGAWLLVPHIREQGDALGDI